MPSRREFSKYLDFYYEEPVVDENLFIDADPDRSPVPTFPDVRDRLPRPHWDGHDSAIECWWTVWELAMRNVHPPTRANGFVSPYIDTAFNECLFLWDSVFILMFARYGRSGFDFQRTLDNLYAKQFADGFICREIHEWDGADQFHRHDPISTGPNVLAWCEWEYYLNYGDRERLAKVLPPLLGYHRWTRKNRSWKDGGYWTCGLGCGMDNQKRLPPGYNLGTHHGFMTWVDATCQAMLSAKLLARMADELGRGREAGDMVDEATALKALINEQLWNDRTGIYADRMRDGTLSKVRSIAGYWAMLSGAATGKRAETMAEHLRDEALFDRPHRVPTLAAEHPGYVPEGGYWNGSVWPPTNYMVLRGLTQYGMDELAHAIGRNHVENVTRVFEETGTVWENYAPETAAPGSPAKRDFVGWGGVGPVAVLLEYVFGLRPDVPGGRLVWDVRLTDAHGVQMYPFGVDGLVDLSVAGRTDAADKPDVSASSTVPLTLEVRWQGGSEEMRLQPA
jgi:hypothetical protein